MSDSFKEALAHFALPGFKSAWGQTVRGIEKESLRVLPDAHLAQDDHPPGLGSALTHPYITTDYSEALLELITPTFTDIGQCLQFLAELHNFSYRNLPDGELLWSSSMPCIVENEQQIPLARYGSSNIGRLKTLYREGLGHRYGRMMQSVAGIHYNFSMPESFWADYREVKQSSESLQEFQTNQYLHLIRNYHRFSWLLVYLFGASPTACSCFTQGREHDLETFDESTVYKPYATCLRMGDLGYRSEAQTSLFVCYNELDNYIESLQKAMSIAWPDYESIGLRKNGSYLQINTNLLQLENEFYATIRPKRVGASGERPLQLLRQSGIQYVEVRLLDVNPFLPMGIDAQQIRFLDAFLLYCLLADSPQCTESEYFETAANLAAVVNSGRQPGLELARAGQAIGLQEWGHELLAGIRHSAALLDQVHAASQENETYASSVEAQVAKLEDVELTPSAQVLRTMQQRKQPFHAFALQQSQAHQAFFRQQPLQPERLEHLIETSRESLRKQAAIEAADDISFDAFLEEWNAFALRPLSA